MSGPLEISLKDKLLFIESLLIPCFDPDNELDTSKKRKDWMRQEANNINWDAGISAELIKRYGTVKSLEEAERKLEDVKAERLLEKAEENERKHANVKSLADGIPQMEQVISESGAFIPPESQHASCEHEIKKVFMLIEFSKDAKKYQNRVWGDCPATLSNLHYTTEADVVSFVKTFLRDVANAMGIPLELASDFGIKHVAPDICVLSLGSRLVGVVEIKKPQKNVLEMPTVLGELFDQMILVEGFYMSGPVIGILTTLEDWMFCWFPADTAHFSTEFEPYTATSAFRRRRLDEPSKDTPSRKNRWSHGVELPEDDCEDPDEFVWTGEVVERALHTSPVINAYTDYDLLLQYLCSAFTRMTQVKLNQRRGVPRSLFKLHKGEDASPKISFHPIDGIPFSVEKITSNKFPRANTKMLLALEDLGRGSTGKAWLCCTLSTSPALCVLKFANKSNNVSARLKQEKEWWDAVYPQFMGMTKVEVWGGSDALVMPHICAIPEVERDEFRERICAMMRTSFHKRGYKHQDVAWRNIGYYVDMEDNIKSPVLFDLERVSAGVESDEWVTEAMSRLF
eukprot:CAMPEP_0173282286 /NCGR_PEP_ID=MMETSP1143-20121109/6724_1 /TAXON_ID=483371 /ORGANISM="non described non described, Strain CCMP2298" /LENGTH=568 /DNA_ID=CAMNT_0014219817 /DNA_START=38 /DNA_END=1742 /DNA_ORIENTATION=-